MLASQDELVSVLFGFPEEFVYNWYYFFPKCLGGCLCTHCFFIIIFYLFIFGCVGSSLLHMGFL